MAKKKKAAKAMPPRSEWTREQKEVMLVAAWCRNAEDNGDAVDELWDLYMGQRTPVPKLPVRVLDKLLDEEFPEDCEDWAQGMWHEYIDEEVPSPPLFRLNEEEG